MIVATSASFGVQAVKPELLTRPNYGFAAAGCVAAGAVAAAVAGFLLLKSFMKARVMSMLVSSIKHRHLAAINNHGDAAGLRESFECFFDILSAEA